MTNVWSGDQVRTESSRGAHSSDPGRTFEVLLVDGDGRPALVSTMYWVLTPMYAASRTTCPSIRLWAGRHELLQPVHPDLLGPDTDVHALAPSIAARGTWTRTSSPSVTLAYASPRWVTVPGNRLLTPEEAGHEPRRRPLVQRLGLAQLLVAPVVHHGDAIGHRHRLLLVVGHVDERDADLALDALELDLHLLAQLEVERAERLVEEQDGGRLMSARARATRCAWPPEISFGLRRS